MLLFRWRDMSVLTKRRWPFWRRASWRRCPSQYTGLAATTVLRSINQYSAALPAYASIVTKQLRISHYGHADENSSRTRFHRCGPLFVPDIARWCTECCYLLMIWCNVAGQSGGHAIINETEACKRAFLTSFLDEGITLITCPWTLDALCVQRLFLCMRN